MNKWQFVICIGLIAIKCNAFTVPHMDFKLIKDGGFEVSLPDEEGIQRVFYLIQVDDICPALADYITRPVNGSWMSRQPEHNLHNNDKVRISVVVQFNDELYEKSETRVILNTRLHTTSNTNTLSISSTLNDGNGKCEAYFEEDHSNDNCKEAQSIVKNGARTCHGELLFEENFDGENINRTIWKHDVRHRMYHVEEELVAFDDSPHNSYILNGELNIEPTISIQVDGTADYKLGDRCTAIESPQHECTISHSFYTINPPVYSAQLHTRESFSFKYGKIVIRAKLPKGDWLFPYIMLQPLSTHAESHFTNQLRVAFARGNAFLRDNKQADISGDRLYGGMIIWDEGRPVQLLKDKLAQKHYGDDFHNYTMIWRRDKLTLMVDDEIYGEIYDGLTIFDEKCFIIVGVTVGGFLNFDDDLLQSDVKPYKNREPRAALAFWHQRDNWASTWGSESIMKIDYIRVYAE